jgi:hypothetical protein
VELRLGYRPNSTKGKNFYRLPFTPPLSGRLNRSFKEAAGRGEDCGGARPGRSRERKGRKEGEGGLTGGTRVSATVREKEKKGGDTGRCGTA